MKKIFQIALFALIPLSFSSCKKFLDEEAYTFVSGEDLIREKNYKQLVSGAYTTLSYPFEFGNYHQAVNFDTDHQTGPAWNYGTMGAGNFYESPMLKSYYQSHYQSIHRANYHSYLINQMEIPAEEKANALGQLSFLKAWAYFNLVQFYGDISLYKTSVSEGAPLVLPRSPIKDVYEHIIETLKFAESSLYEPSHANYKKGDVSRGAAMALLAKVYCTIGSASMATGNQIQVNGGRPFYLDDKGAKIRYAFPSQQNFSKNQVAGYESFDSKAYYKLGMDKAKELIDLKYFDLYASHAELWNPASKNGKEFIFSLQTLAGDEKLSNFVASDYVGYYNVNGVLTSGNNILRDHWFQLFDETDERITWGVKHRVPFNYNATTGVTLWSYYPARDSVKVRLGIDGYKNTDLLRYDANLYGAKLNKFTQVTVPFDGKRTDFNFPFIRFAEVILLYAEADNEVNGAPSQNALAQVARLNTRNKSRLVNNSTDFPSWSQVSFRSYILEERAKEFGAEGIRRFDLLRWGIYLQTMNSLGGTDENDIVKRREAKHLLYPFPSDEINTNPNFTTNNPGW